MTEIQASLYEHLFPLTTVMKQRVVDNFDGDELNERWNFTNGAGSGSGVMEDVVDAGFLITCGTANNNFSHINFNDKRPYEPTAMVFLGVCKIPTTTNCRVGLGLTNLVAFGSHNVILGIRTDDSSTNWVITSRNTSQTFLAGGSAFDTNLHIHHCTCGSSNLVYDVDDVLQATKTDQRPTLKQQPVCIAQTISGGAKTGNFLYYEAYNT